MFLQRVVKRWLTRKQMEKEEARRLAREAERAGREQAAVRLQSHVRRRQAKVLLDERRAERLEIQRTQAIFSDAIPREATALRDLAPLSDREMLDDALARW